MFKYYISVIFILLFSTLLAQTKNQTDAKGLKQGYWEKIDSKTGKISYKGTFKDNKPQGVFYYYYSGTDSVRSKSDFRQDGKIAYVTMYHTTGKMEAKGKYINEEKDSVWNFYYDRGALLSTDTYVKGKKNGLTKVYFEKGAVEEEKNYKNDLLEGVFKQYFDEKKTLRAEGTYVANEYDGRCSWYYPNGIAAAQGFYDKGVKKGVWLYKTEKGAIKEKEVWQNGKQLNQKEMDAYFKSKNITFPEDTKTAPKTNNNTSPKK
ncbi:MAG: toxin-antitoxin system YwqK family antitoxin [Bacteroidia bacterium]